jgi:ferredoxin
VQLVSLESLEEMPADTVEIREGDEEGIARVNGWGPIEIVRSPSGAVEGVRFRRCLRVYDERRRFAPVYEESDVRTIPCDTVLLAVGQAPELGFLADGGGDVEQVRPGWPRVDATTLATSAPGVFVAGDLAHGTRLLIDAVASGKKAARSIYRHLTGRELRPEATSAHLALPRYRRERGYESRRRVELPVAPPSERLRRPDAEVELELDERAARLEAGRCLDCGVTPVFDGERCVLCGGCVDVCPTRCLALVGLEALEPSGELERAVRGSLGPDAAPEAHSALLKDEDRCIRCALCAARCPADAVSMERLTFATTWCSS